MTRGSTSAQQGTLALRGVRVWDGESDACAPERLTLRVERGRIGAIGASPRFGDAARVLDLDGAVAIPGLCDAHVHMTLDGAGPPGAIPDSDLPALELAMQERAKAMVAAGITTARDLGGGTYSELALRDRIARGDAWGPRLLCAGQPVTSRAGHCHFWGGEAHTADEIRAVVRRQIARGADWIKVMATGGMLTQGTNVAEAQFETAELELIVDEARASGRAVAAHCHATEGIRRAAQAGVRTIEHCSWVGADGFGTALDPEVVGLIAEGGAFVSPTVNAGWRRFLDSDRGGPFVDRMRTCLRSLKERGVPLIASTDAGIPRVEHHRLPEALAVFALLAELRPVEVLRCATSTAADALGLPLEIGRLRPGLAADVLVVDGDPLQDLEALTRPLAVLARGRLVEIPRSA